MSRGKKIGGLEKIVGYKPPRDNGCFPGTTRVLTPYGEIPIERLHVGDEVFSYDTRRRCVVVRRITRKLTHPASRIFELSFTSRRAPLLTTGYHTFLTDCGWVKASRLKAGCRILNRASQTKYGSSISKVEATSRIEPVFNLYTEGEHNFIVEGLVAHNFTFVRELRTVLHASVFDKWQGAPRRAPVAPGNRGLRVPPRNILSEM